jgi:YfiH family protein
MYPVIRAKNRMKTFMQKEHILQNGEKLEYLVFPSLEEIPWVEQVFSTRMGGVSENEFSSMNFSFVRGDNPEAVLENYRRVSEIFGSSCDSFVTTDQTHTTNIRVVGKEDAGKGVTISRDYTDTDGLITDQKGLILSCFFADCVPLYFVDVKKKVIGLAHSGWRGTVEGMGACMVKRMVEEFGCNPTDILAGIGASIC